MPIYYCYEKKTGRFAGSGVTNIKTATHGSTTTAPDEALAEQEEEMGWQWKNGVWLRKKATEITEASLVEREVPR